VIDRLNPLKSEKLIILADPQRMIRAGARAVDGWAKENGFTVLFCSGNLALREMYENLRDDPTAKLILVDRNRDKAKLPLFYPDLEARCKPRARLTITLRDFLTEKSGDQRWPLLVNTDRNIGRLILENLPQALQAHSQLREVDEHRFTACLVLLTKHGSSTRIAVSSPGGEYFTVNLTLTAPPKEQRVTFELPGGDVAGKSQVLEVPVTW